MRTGKSWSSMCKREQHRSGRESWTPLCPVQMISRTTEFLYSGRNTCWLQDRLWSYVDPRKATRGRVHEHAIEGHYRRSLPDSAHRPVDECWGASGLQPSCAIMSVSDKREIIHHGSMRGEGADSLRRSVH